MPNPYITGLPWASAANYAAGAYAWSAQPTKVSPGYSAFQPSQAFAPTAQEMNALQNQRDQAILYNANAVGAYRLVEATSAGVATGFGTQFFTGAGWGGVAAFTTGLQSTLGAFSNAPAAGDIFEVRFSSSLYLLNGSSAVSSIQAALRLEYTLDGGSTYSPFTGAIAEWQRNALPIGISEVVPVSLFGNLVIGSTPPASVHVALNGCAVASSTPVTMGCANAWTVMFRHWSPNP